MLAFFSCSEWGLLSIAACKLLFAVASLAIERRLLAGRFQQVQCVGSVVGAQGL